VHEADLNAHRVSSKRIQIKINILNDFGAFKDQYKIKE
jgi:hypothetical protein